MGEVVGFPRPQRVVVDEQGHALRLTWHREARTLVISVWHEDRCVGTFRSDAAVVRDLTSFLVEALGDAAVAREPARSRGGET